MVLFGVPTALCFEMLVIIVPIQCATWERDFSEIAMEYLMWEYINVRF